MHRRCGVDPRGLFGACLDHLEKGDLKMFLNRMVLVVASLLVASAGCASPDGEEADSEGGGQAIRGAELLPAIARVEIRYQDGDKSVCKNTSDPNIVKYLTDSFVGETKDVEELPGYQNRDMPMVTIALFNKEDDVAGGMFSYDRSYPGDKKGNLRGVLRVDTSEGESSYYAFKFNPKMFESNVTKMLTSRNSKKCS
jgi:hypothetical protein